VYVYLIYGKTSVWLIDTGVAGSEQLILDYLQATGRDPRDLALLILTHSHPDHLGAARAIQQATGCAVAAHPAERSWIEEVDVQFRQRPVPGFSALVGGSVAVDRLLQDGERLDLDENLALEVLHTPGHSPGSISLWCPQERALICGDAVPLPGSVPIYDAVFESVRSVQKLAAICDVQTLLSSWDEPRTGQDVALLLDQSLAYLQRIHCSVRQHAAVNIDPLALCQLVFTELGLPEVAVTPLVARTMTAHLAARQVADLAAVV